MPAKSRNSTVCRKKYKYTYKMEVTKMKVNAYLEITMKINEENRAAAAKVYTDYKASFLAEIKGALTKDLLVRNEDVQVLHGFDSVENAGAYLESEMFKNDVFFGSSSIANSPISMIVPVNPSWKIPS